MGRKSGTYPHTWLSGPDEVDHKLYIDCLRARAQANFRGEGWTITEQEYIKLWRTDDRYKLKGRGTESLCLVRIDLEKAWTLDNVEIIERIKHFRRSGKETKERHLAKQSV
jgi:5-methylcytosine-specific restriction endonuclease McrA